MFTDEIREIASSLTADELRQVIDALKEMVVSALAGPDAEPDACPRCGCTAFVRDGLDKRYSKGKVVERVQRYECRGCGRSFTRKTNSLLNLSKLTAETWTKFVDLAVERKSISACAEELGVSEPTVHYMRIRLCEVMGSMTPKMDCGEGDSCQIDGTYLNESLKGRGRRGAEMPRASHKTGHDVRSRGISNEKVCVLVGVDDSGRQFAELCDRGRPTDEAVRERLEGKVGAGATCSTDDHQAYERVLPQLGVSNHLVFPSDGSAGDGLYKASSVHKRLKDFLRGFNGVSTRYLDYYCQWSDFLEFVRRAGRDLTTALQDIVAKGRHSVRRETLYGSKPPFWDYWEGKTSQPDFVVTC